MHDDMAYTIAEAAYALAMLRRVDLLTDKTPKQSFDTRPTFASIIDF